MRIVALLSLVIAACCAAPSHVEPHAEAPIEGRPLTPAHRGESMAAANDRCVACHANVATDWRASLHRASWSERAFQRAYAREPLAFCRGCHAPEAPIEEETPSAAIGALGVGCVTCHMDGDAILGASGPGHGPAPHAVLRDGRLDGDAACAGCHEFVFPKGGAPMTTRAVPAPVPMQSTVGEHRASPAAARACASCHMPEGDAGHRGHAFVSSRDEATMRTAVRVEARREGPTRVELRLTSLVAGHAFPTGDLFRRIEVLAEAVGPDESLAASSTRYLGRHFPFERIEPGGPRLRAFGPDDRLRQEPALIVLELGDAARNLPIRYRVAYQRVAHPRSADEQASELDGEVVLAHGELAP